MSLPPDLHRLADYRRHAATRLPEDVWRHIEEGSGGIDHAAYDAIRLLPRRLVDLRGGHTGVDLLGQRHASPIMLAPVAYHKLAHPEGERATIRAATAMGVAMALSTLSSITMEEVARASREAARELGQADPPHWFQLYLQPSRERSLALVRRAEAAEYKAILVTVDAAVKRAGFPLPQGVEAANLRGFPPVQHTTARGAILLGTPLADQAPRWGDIAWLRGQTSLPLIIKGLMAPQDGVRAAELGADGIVLSHHGGRVLDSLPSALDLLPAMRAAVGADMPLLVDGGIRCGTDIVKALALGAQGVLVGRPQMHALAVGGFAGVAHMLHMLRAELELAMAQLGCPTVADITPEVIFRP